MSDKNTKAVIVGANELALALIPVLKDGVQPVQDFAALFAKYQSDADFKAKIDAAFQASVNGLAGEVPTLGFEDGLDLIQTQLSYVPKIVAAVKG